MTASPWIAAPVALFLWWFSTGAILWVVRRNTGASHRVALWSLPVLLAGAAGFLVSLDGQGTGSVYLGFVSALAIWGWIELAFLCGLITGPNDYPCPRDAALWERFIRAWGTIAYHEILLVLIAMALAAISWTHPNTVGAWCFGILFVARISAKLNLFFGVPKFNTEFLPDHLSHLPSHFRIARMNWFFPISVTLLSVAVAFFMTGAGHATNDQAKVAQILLASLTALALIEHWLLVLPLPDAKLWRWMLPEAKPLTMRTEREGPHGF